MVNVLIGFIVGCVLAIYLFGWLGVLYILGFCFFACFTPRGKQGKIISFVEKLGTK